MASLGENCAQSETSYTVLKLINLLATGGMSIIGTNLLCHRYLVEKARVMIKLYVTHELFPYLSSPPPCPPLKHVVFMC